MADVSLLRGGVSLNDFRASLEENSFRLAMPRALIELVTQTSDLDELRRVLDEFDVPTTMESLQRKIREVQEFAGTSGSVYSVPEEDEGWIRESATYSDLRHEVEHQFQNFSGATRDHIHKFLIEVLHAAEVGQRVGRTVKRYGLALFGIGKGLASRTLELLGRSGRRIVRVSKRSIGELTEAFRKWSRKKSKFIKAHREFLVEVSIDGIYFAIAVFFVGPQTVHAAAHLGKDVIVFVYNGIPDFPEALPFPPGL